MLGKILTMYDVLSSMLFDFPFTELSLTWMSSTNPLILFLLCLSHSAHFTLIRVREFISTPVHGALSINSNRTLQFKFIHRFNMYIHYSTVIHVHAIQTARSCFYSTKNLKFQLSLSSVCREPMFTLLYPESNWLQV